LFQTVERCAEFDKVQERDKDENRKVIRIGGKKHNEEVSNNIIASFTSCVRIIDEQ